MRILRGAVTKLPCERLLFCVSFSAALCWSLLCHDSNSVILTHGHV